MSEYIDRHLLDRAIAAAALVVAGPVLALAAALVKASDPGPVLYKAPRVGKHGQRFRMYKLRTMRNVGDATQSRITAYQDARVYPTGKFLRALKIDELPQLINVLRGEMAFVGPRPEDPEIVDRFYSQAQRESLGVLPGLTSPGSIFSYTHGEALLGCDDPEGDYSRDLLPIKLALDMEYVERASLLYDIKLLYRTCRLLIGAALGQREFSEPPEMARARARLESERGRAAGLPPPFRRTACATRILFVSAVDTWGGGAEVCLLHMIRAARRAGYAPFLATAPGEVERRLGSLCDQVYVLPMPIFERTRNPRQALTWLRAGVTAIWQLDRIIRSSEAAVVHANSGVASLSACVAARLANRPLVWHQHDIIPPRPINRLILAACGRLAGLVVGTSGAVTDSLEQLGIPDTKMRILYPRIDDALRSHLPDRTASRNALGMPDGRYILTVIGRVVRRKGHDVFLGALEKLVEQGVDVHGAIVGKMPDEATDHAHDVAYLAELRHRASQPALAGRVRFLGHSDDVAAILAASDILVMPSRLEPFGRVIIEAFAAGVPVISSASGGALELIRDGESGLLVPPGDEAAFAAAIRRVLEDPNLAAWLAGNARRTADGSFFEDSLPGELEDIYSGILPAGCGRRSSQSRETSFPDAKVPADHSERSTVPEQRVGA